MEPCAPAALVHRPPPPGSSQTSDNQSPIPPHGDRYYSRPYTSHLDRTPSSNSILGDSDTPQGDSIAIAAGNTNLTPSSPGSNDVETSSTRNGFTNAEKIDKLNDRPVPRFLHGKTFLANRSKSNSKDNTLSDTNAGSEATVGVCRPSSSSSGRSLRLRIFAGFKDIAARSRSPRQSQPISTPSQWKHIPSSEASSSSNLLLSSCYLTDTNLTSSTSQRSPNPAFDSNDSHLLSKGPSPALDYIEKKNWRKYYFDDPVLAFVDRFKNKHSRRRRRQGPPTAQLGDGSSGGGTKFEGSPSGGAKSGTTPGTRAKRPNIDGGGDNPGNDEDGDDNDGPSHKRSKPDKGTDNLFACPYFKRDPTKNWACEKFQFTTWAHVKQHLRRNHDLKEYQCPRCGFRYKTRSACDEHIRSCEVSNCISPIRQTNLDSISEEAQRAITQIPPRKRDMTDVDRWNKAWEILFGPIPQPDTPFKKDTPTELLAYFRKQLLSRPRAVDDILIAENTVSSIANVDRVLSLALKHVTSVPDAPQRSPIPTTMDDPQDNIDAASRTNLPQMHPIAEAMPEEDHGPVDATLVSAAAGGDPASSSSPLFISENDLASEGEFSDLLCWGNFEDNMDSTLDDTFGGI